MWWSLQKFSRSLFLNSLLQTVVVILLGSPWRLMTFIRLSTVDILLFFWSFTVSKKFSFVVSKGYESILDGLESAAEPRFDFLSFVGFSSFNRKREGRIRRYAVFKWDSDEGVCQILMYEVDVHRNQAC